MHAGKLSAFFFSSCFPQCLLAAWRSLQDLSFPHQGLNTRPLAVKAQSHNHWTAREFPTMSSKVLHEEAFCLPNVYWMEKKKEVPRDLFSTTETSNARNGQPGNITMIVTVNSGFIECLPCAKQHSKCFLFIISFNPTTIQETREIPFFKKQIAGPSKEKRQLVLKKIQTWKYHY